MTTDDDYSYVCRARQMGSKVVLQPVKVFKYPSVTETFKVPMIQGCHEVLVSPVQRTT